LAALLTGVDVLYHEATYATDRLEMAEKYYHSTASQAASVARDAGVRQLVIGHFSSRYNHEEVLLNEALTVFPNTVLAREMAVFDV
jgi:ribonuclease Z